MRTRRSDCSKVGKNNSSSLICAIRYGKDLETIKKLLKDGLDVNASVAKGNTPLIQAIRCRRELKLIKELISYGADVNAHDNAGNTPLILSTRFNKKPKIIKELLISGAGINVQNCVDETPLMMAARYCRKLEVIKELLLNGADANAVSKLGNTALTVAIKYGRKLEVIKELLKHITNVNVINNKGDTALHQAIMNSSPAIIKQLLKSGADVSIRNDTGNTPLILAARYCKNHEVIKELLESGSHINAQNNAGDTPLTVAIKYSNKLKVINKLLECGADTNVHNEAGDTPLILAIKCSKGVAFFEQLVKFGADVNSFNSSSDTPLNFAIRCKKDGIIIELLKCGANPNVVNTTGNTPLNEVIKQNINIKVIKELLMHFANVNAVSNEGETPLCQAIRCQDYVLIEELLRNGVDFNFANTVTTSGSEGCPVDLLRKLVRYNINCAELLMSHHVIQNIEKDCNINLNSVGDRWDYRRLARCKEKCICEIEKMKDVQIKGNLSLYKFVTTKDLNVALLPSDNGTKYTTGEKKVSEFYVYSNLISQKLKYAQERLPLLNDLSDLQVYTNSLAVDKGLVSEKVVLVREATLAIAKYLSNYDLRNVIIAFRRCHRTIYQFSGSSHDFSTDSEEFEMTDDKIPTECCSKRPKLD